MRHDPAEGARRADGESGEGASAMMVVPFILNSVFNFLTGILIAKFLGPSQFGVYALALSVAVVMQTIGLDWLRLSATRFYSEQDRAERPEVRATLNFILTAVVALAAVSAALVLLFGGGFAVSSHIAALAIGGAMANGLFEFSTALVRARFHNRGYGALVFTKSLMVVVLMIGGSWCFGTAAAALIGLILSAGGAVLLNLRVLTDEQAVWKRADVSLGLRYAAYAVPIVLANVLYQIVPATNRALVSHLHSFAEAGQLALAFEIGIRILGTIGSTLDVLLFQLAVLAEKTFGPAAARDRVATNMGIVLAVVAPAAVGCWLVLPSFERLVVPASYQGPFAHYFALMLPALVCFAIANYCIGPAFQIAHRTSPLIVGGVVAVAADVLAIVLLPPSQDATTFALAQSISSIAGLVVLIGFLSVLEPMRPRWRDIAGSLAGVGAMLVTGWPLRGFPPGVLTLALQVGVGALVYGFAVYATDVARVRSLAPAMSATLLTRLRRSRATAGSEPAAGEAARG